MKGALGLVLLAGVAVGCASGTPAAPAGGGAVEAVPSPPPGGTARPALPPAPELSPPEAAPPSTATTQPFPFTPAAPPKAVTPAPRPAPAPLVSPRIENEDQAVREVNARLARAGQVIDQINPDRLAHDQREMFSSIQNFIAKAQQALLAKDMPRAEMLADKASHLAEDLAGALNKKPR